jgi:hypothetical protein
LGPEAATGVALAVVGAAALLVGAETPVVAAGAEVEEVGVDSLQAGIDITIANKRMKHNSVKPDFFIRTSLFCIVLLETIYSS